MKHGVKADWYVGIYLEELVRIFEIPVMIPKWLHKNLEIWDYAYWKAQILDLKYVFSYKIIWYWQQQTEKKKKKLFWKLSVSSMNIYEIEYSFSKFLLQLYFWVWGKVCWKCVALGYRTNKGTVGTSTVLEKLCKSNKRERGLE